ncbi:hypothetical protein [Zeaxanthinibacter enoshimensis]|uniref:Uncharacterized protein n=1 Tax=Zeaxanthinibacter enoshimensis TaxID=392009 RepID=A0A4R6THF0_9FLAO|nr:hypothetical protein [Zeaxanthinibacter enoshimensis]TDQ29303.1 hypothetical protein CLV82_2759 [Zeaxanthinibacter enoshimensis]
MKKFLGALLIAILLFIGLLYISLHSTSGEEARSVILEPGPSDNLNLRDYDSVKLMATDLYQANALKKLMQGRQYRDAWASPVTVPIVFLDTLMGGMKIIEEGGGKQTHSLEIESPAGVRYSLRSITKNPKPLVPDIAEKLALENIIIDGVSAQHPYAAIVVADMAEKAGLMHTHPKVVFVPEQPLLGSLNEKYGNRLFLLEYETEGKTNWTAMENVLEIMDTEDLQELKVESARQVSIDKHILVRNRLFDLLIGDWDRHAKQWGWVIQDTPDGYLATPLAGDRDNAFFHLGGIVPTLISNRRFLPNVQPLENDIDYMTGLVMDFDRFFLLKVPESIFLEEAKYLQETLTDEVIRESFNKWPENIYRLDAPEIIKKVISRRNKLQESAKAFYEAIQEQGPINEPLKGSEDSRAGTKLLPCFECH